jgi:hypothetical protein
MFFFFVEKKLDDMVFINLFSSHQKPSSMAKKLGMCFFTPKTYFSHENTNKIL